MSAQTELDLNSHEFAWVENGLDIKAALMGVRGLTWTYTEAPGADPFWSWDDSDDPFNKTVIYEIEGAGQYEWNADVGAPGSDSIMIRREGDDSFAALDRFDILDTSGTLERGDPRLLATNPQARRTDETRTLLAGVLLGVSGGALVGALQEGLNGRRRHRPELPSPAG
jgi:hypothetical protein